MENKIQNLEDELKVLKNEVQAVLLDIKEFMISSEGISGAMGGAAGVGGSGGLSLPSFDATGTPVTMDGHITSPADPTASPFNITGGSMQPDSTPQQAITTQLDPDVVSLAETVLDEVPELGETTLGEDIANEVVMSSGEKAGPADMDWSGVVADQAALGPGEGPGFGEETRNEGAANLPESDPFVNKAGSTEIRDEVDLPMLAILAPWLSRAVSTVGKEHLQKLIEIYDVARDMPPRLKEAVLILLDLYGNSGTCEPSGDATVTEGITLLIELDSLLLRHRTGSLESAVLSLLQERLTKNSKPRSRKPSNG